MLSYKPTFSLSSFTFIKRLFSSSSLSAIRVVSSAYLRLLIFLLAILIPACVSSSPAFLMMYSAHKLNKQGDNIQPNRSRVSRDRHQRAGSLLDEIRRDKHLRFRDYAGPVTDRGVRLGRVRAARTPHVE